MAAQNAAHGAGRYRLYFFPYFFGMKHLLAAVIAVVVYGCAGNSTDSTAAPSDTPSNNRLGNIQPGNALSPIDRSPMDMAYFPVDFPVRKTSRQVSGAPLARVIYSRPHRQGRAVFGGLVPYGQPWRLGANEATELELFAPATIQNQTVPGGRYILYCIPDSTRWTVVFNSNLFTWGLGSDSSLDTHRFTIPVAQKERLLEDFTMVFAPGDQQTELIIAWEKAEARLPIQFRQ